jgi:hypothetical protein
MPYAKLGLHGELWVREMTVDTHKNVTNVPIPSVKRQRGDTPKATRMIPDVTTSPLCVYVHIFTHTHIYCSWQKFKQKIMRLDIHSWKCTATFCSSSQQLHSTWTLEMHLETQLRHVLSICASVLSRVTQLADSLPRASPATCKYSFCHNKFQLRKEPREKPTIKENRWIKCITSC